MKKLFLLLVMTFGIVATAFADDYAYVSNVENYGYLVKVTVSAKGGAFEDYPDGFMVGVRPANNIIDWFIGGASINNKTVTLTPEEPSKTIEFRCDDGNTGEKACSRDEFVVKLKNR